MSLKRDIDVIAECMWDVINPSPEKDWAWCVENDPSTAQELRNKARRTIDKHNLVLVEKSSNKKSESQLDLRFKEAFVGSSK